MLDPSSRYYSAETATLETTDENGNTVRYLYKRRRFLPRLREQTTMLEHTVRQGDRLDNLSVQYYYEPLSAFRLVDGNPVLHPEELLQLRQGGSASGGAAGSGGAGGARRIRVSMPSFSNG